MRVLVTGAAGRLGSMTCPILAQAGHEVIAVDRATRDGPGFELRVLDLLDTHAVARLFGEGVEAVVHLANHPSVLAEDPVRGFNENVAMNMNVFDPARRAGVRALIFASSVQVFASTQAQGENAWGPAVLPYLPLDGDVPANPRNPYALSKAVGEVMLGMLARQAPTRCVALRFPWLVPHDRPMAPGPGPGGPERIQQAFSYLTYRDAARLIAALLSGQAPETGAPGKGAYEVHFPVAAENTWRRPAAELIETHYRGVPLKQPIGATNDLVDLSGLTRQTGWRPEDRVVRG